MSTRKKVLFIIPYPLREAPSQRFRFEQYFPALEANSIEFEVQSFLDKQNWRIFYCRGNGPRKALALMEGFWRRVVGLFDVWRYDILFIHREASPVGPPVFEWIVAKVFRKKIIYDYDDAIWLTDNRNESTLIKLLRHRGKISTICSLSYRVSCGNTYLAVFAKQFNRDVVINPTTIDTQRVREGLKAVDPPTTKPSLSIGWTGSHSTLKYLEKIEGVLQRVAHSYPNVTFIVIADRPPEISVPQLTFVPWKEETEIADLRKIDIGIMPLPDDEWSKGKCGFKILQYMSLGIPSVSSAVGANLEIVTHGENGYLCESEEEWFIHVSKLIESASLRQRLGEAGRATVERRYSVNSNTPTFLSLFE